MTERTERRGGARIAGPGKKIGRPAMNRKPMTIYVTDVERAKILKAVPRLRETAAARLRKKDKPMKTELNWMGAGWYAPTIMGDTEVWYIIGAVDDSFHSDKFAAREASEQARRDNLGTPRYLNSEEEF